MATWEMDVENACDSVRAMFRMLRENNTRQATGMVTFHHSEHGHIVLSIDSTAEGLKQACADMIARYGEGESEAIESSTVEIPDCPTNLEDN